MNIGIDARFIENPYSSIGVFQRNIVNNILEIDTSNRYYVFVTNEGRRFLRASDRMKIVTLSSANLLLSSLLIGSAVNHARIELFFATFNISPIFQSNVRVVLQNHDFSHGIHDLTLTKFLPSKIYRHMHLSSVKKSQFLLANSLFTREEIEKLVPGKPIRVIYHDCDPAFKSSRGEEDLEFGSPRGHTVLYAGRVAPKYKNISVLLRAFRQYKRIYPTSRLVIVYNDEVRPADRRFDTNEKLNVVFLRNVSRKILAELYLDALMFVYPTSYEGFGSPILEAQNSGCPLILNNVPPLPEVGGKAALYYDGTVNDLITKMIALTQDTALQEKVIREGFVNARRFDWKTTARETLDCISKLG